MNAGLEVNHQLFGFPLIHDEAGNFGDGAAGGIVQPGKGFLEPALAEGSGESGEKLFGATDGQGFEDVGDGLAFVIQSGGDGLRSFGQGAEGGDPDEEFVANEEELERDVGLEAKRF